MEFYIDVFGSFSHVHENSGEIVVPNVTIPLLASGISFGFSYKKSYDLILNRFHFS